MMCRLLAVVLLCMGSLTHGAQAAGDQERTLKEIQRLEAFYGGHLGVMAKNLLTGEVVAYNQSERFPTASVIKFPVMTAFFHLVDQKKIDPAMKVHLTKDDKKPGSGILQFMSDTTTITLLDAVKLMIDLSDNTATNLVLDRLAPTHEARLQTVNDFLVQKGLTNTRLLNRLYSWQTKRQTPEAIRYGIGVATPEDMVLLLEALYKRTLCDSGSCALMLDILKQQFYEEMIPRLLPASECKYFEVPHKTGSVNETKVDVGLVLSDKATYAVAIFVDKQADHSGNIEDRGYLLAAYVSRALWNHFTGMAGYEHNVTTHDVDWNRFPGGRWAIYRSSAAPFPHKARLNGFTRSASTFYPYQPHYCDSSIIVFVPETFKETEQGTNLIVHFHGHMNDNLGALERYMMPQAMIAQKINALLVLPQGPCRARDSFGGKMEDKEGLRKLVDDVLMTMKRESVATTTKLNHVIISSHSGGGRSVGFCLDRGGLNDHITNVFLFDALYEQQDFFRTWLMTNKGFLWGVYTDHLTKEHQEFLQSVTGEPSRRLNFAKTDVAHEEVIQTYFSPWLAQLDASWRTEVK